VLLAVLLAVTVAASIAYYRQVRRAQKEYEKAKSLVEDIVLSFNRELKREADRLELVTFKVEASASKADASDKKIDVLEGKISPLGEQLTTLTQTVTQSSNNTLASMTDLESKLKDIQASQEALKAKIGEFEEQAQRPAEPRPEPVILLKRDKAMASLTDTEIAVLEMLSKEGAKTAPEIKERVQLSREHTARLMKKLYEEGYLERETGKIPFRYSVKKEMGKLLENPETKPT
jgi:hypothetical protein